MSGYCPDCGNTLCLCKEIAAQEATNDGTYTVADIFRMNKEHG